MLYLFFLVVSSPSGHMGRRKWNGRTGTGQDFQAADVMTEQSEIEKTNNSIIY